MSFDLASGHEESRRLDVVLTRGEQHEGLLQLSLDLGVGLAEVAA